MVVGVVVVGGMGGGFSLRLGFLKHRLQGSRFRLGSSGLKYVLPSPIINSDSGGKLSL